MDEIGEYDMYICNISTYVRRFWTEAAQHVGDAPRESIDHTTWMSVTGRGGANRVCRAWRACGADRYCLMGAHLRVDAERT